MHKSQSLFYLTTPLHFSGVTITHFHEQKTTVTTSGNRYTVFLSVVIVKELELSSNSAVIVEELELSYNSVVIVE
jgi:hypothetical protein